MNHHLITIKNNRLLHEKKFWILVKSQLYHKRKDLYNQYLVNLSACATLPDWNNDLKGVHLLSINLYLKESFYIYILYVLFICFYIFKHLYITYIYYKDWLLYI